MMRLNHQPQELQIGQKVVTDWDFKAPDVVRTLTTIFRDQKTGSGYKAAADAGEPCPHCHRTFTEPTPAVDAAWFRPVEDQEEGSKG